MTNLFSKLREQALSDEKQRRENSDEIRKKSGERAEDRVFEAVAELIERDVEEVAACCGSICPKCDMFLDKAVALRALDNPHHLFMNPTQNEIFEKALNMFLEDKKEYQANRLELMERLRER
jgi:hypothetical protein